MPVYCPTKEHVTMTVNALTSLLDFGAPDQIIIVDDGSPYTSMSWGVVGQVVRKHQNEGFPKAVNLGWTFAENDVIITANNDLTFNPGWLEGILYPLEHGYDISSILVSDQNNWELTEEIEENAKFGSLWAQRRYVYESIGGFDERFGRGYFEDLDYRRQALNRGYRIGKYHGALVEHEGRATFDFVDPRHELYEHNKQVFIDKWGFIE